MTIGRTLIPLLNILNDFSDILISDDAKDILVFRTASHGSFLHHNQLGVILKGLTELGLRYFDMGQKMLQHEENQNKQLKQIQRLLREDREDYGKEERIKSLKAVMNAYLGPQPEQKRGYITYDQYLAEMGLPPRPKPRVIKALPEKLPPRPPRAPRL